MDESTKEKKYRSSSAVPSRSSNLASSNSSLRRRQSYDESRSYQTNKKITASKPKLRRHSSLPERGLKQEKEGWWATTETAKKKESDAIRRTALANRTKEMIASRKSFREKVERRLKRREKKVDKAILKQNNVMNVSKSSKSGFDGSGGGGAGDLDLDVDCPLNDDPSSSNPLLSPKDDNNNEEDVDDLDIRVALVLAQKKEQEELNIKIENEKQIQMEIEKEKQIAIEKMQQEALEQVRELARQ
eukprot:CAMPEP_0114365894 /NCGR_PEP_ID=MMETSP0101-20121206/28807_1 /TAXON_ID=38822 ORGANISM="Pteridomonas danica, Strain PT" /NCGR_SAMPLE_ID=MMETSP0101 /ASSEMBLY_ACC=CAM_ASM_000211 /LENGTH=244 /DNA_ID=CAMNT_0001514561 /DNA_START=8 /DNA_END=739 /DNA_ORIENTATION=+